MIMTRELNKVGLPAVLTAQVGKRIAGIVAQQNELRTAIDEIVADIEGK